MNLGQNQISPRKKEVMEMEKSKKCLSLCLIAVLVFGLSSIGWAAEEEKWPGNLVIEGMGVGTSAYIVTAAVARAIMDDLGIRTQVTAGTPSPICATKVGEGDSDLGMASGDPAYEAFEGLGRWKGKPLKNLRVLAGVTLIPTQFITWPDTGINSVADLKGKTLMGEQVGSSHLSEVTDAVLAVNGLTRNDVKVISWREYGEQLKFIRMKLGDAIFLNSGLGTAPNMELDRTIKWKFISFTEKEIKAILKARQYFTRFTIPAGIYTQQPQEIRCVAIPCMLLINAKLPDGLAYQLCKILFDKPGRFISVHRDWGKFDLKIGTSVRTAPYHAGAVKYYKERGEWGVEADKWQKEMLQAAGLPK
jgi:TRAP transporter TAXI family solute receptor